MNGPSLALDVLGLGVALPGTDKPAQALSVPAAGAGWFEVAAALPGRGYKRLPPACQYLLAATRNALADCGDALAAVPAERRGVIVGTNNAGLALHDEQDRTIIERGADDIAPLSAPYFATSLFAARLATEHAVNGFTLTVNSPRTAALDAVRAGARALAAGRAEVLVVGAAEETLPPGEPGAEGSDTGAAALICVPAANRPRTGTYGTVRVRSAFLPPGGDPATALAGAWSALCAGAAPPRVEAVLDDSPAGVAVANWLAGRAEGLTVHRAGAGALTPLRHLVAPLASGEDPGRLVVTASAEGHVALARLSARDINHPHPKGNRE